MCKPSRLFLGFWLVGAGVRQRVRCEVEVSGLSKYKVQLQKFDTLLSPRLGGKVSLYRSKAAAAADRSSAQLASTPPRELASDVPSTHVRLGSSSAYISGERSRLTAPPFTPAHVHQDRISPGRPLPRVIHSHPPTSVLIRRTKLTQL